MIKLIKKNPALYIGLALPLLMVLLFAGIPFIASFMVQPPKYNFIYSVNSYQMDVKFSVIDGRLELNVYNRSNYPNDPPSVYLIDVHSKENTQLSFVSNNEKNLLVPPHEYRTFIVEGISLKDLDTSMISPDGYQFISDNGDNFSLFPLFFGGNRRNLLSISKLGRIERFQNTLGGYWASKFEGWVIP
jgi:hypothetical protein